ncbi:hypothetical protein D3C76_1754960 [compost metagenome]
MELDVRDDQVIKIRAAAIEQIAAIILDNARATLALKPQRAIRLDVVSWKHDLLAG